LWSLTPFKPEPVEDPVDYEAEAAKDIAVKNKRLLDKARTESFGEIGKNATMDEVKAWLTLHNS